jgi:DNA invertase Pin-like site-specific DNA recombinase
VAVSAAGAPKAVLYARISEDPNGDALKVDEQLARCRKHAADQGWEVVAEKTDNDISALTGAYRPGYEDVLHLVRAGEVRYVVVWQSSRLLRNRRERAEAIELFGRQRVGIIAVKGISFDLSTAYGRGQAGLMGEFDTMESEVKAERVAATAADRARRGAPSGSLGYGWAKHGAGSTATYTEDPHEAGVTREIVDRLLSGEPLRSVTASLNERGELSPEATAWARLSDAEKAARLAKRGKEPPAAWGKTSVKKLAMRESNVAVRVHHRGRPDAERYTGTWPAIVDPAKHHKVIALLSEPSRRVNGGTRENPVRPGARRHLLSWGVAECGVCGGYLKLTNRKTARYGKPYSFYTCDENGCVGRSQAGLNDLVRAIVIERMSRPDALDWLMGDDAEAKRLTACVAELSGLLDEAADDYAAKRITRPVFLRLCANYQSDLAAAESALGLASARLDVEVLLPLAGPESAARWDAMAVAQQRAVLETLGLRVIVNRSGHRGPGFDPASVQIRWRDARLVQ